MRIPTLEEVIEYKNQVWGGKEPNSVTFSKPSKPGQESVKNVSKPLSQMSDKEAEEELYRHSAQGIEDEAHKWYIEKTKGKDWVSPADRISAGTQSIMASIAGSIPVWYDTAKQTAKNLKNDADNPQIQTLTRQLEQAYLDASNNRSIYGNNSAQQLEAERRAEALLSQINTLRDKTPTQFNPYSESAMSYKNEMAQKTLQGLEGVGRKGAEIALSIGQNLPGIAASAVLPGSGLVMMGAQAGADKMYQLSKQGISAEEALNRGAASASIELLTEKIPLDNVLRLAKGTGKGFIKNLLKQAGIEATEEGVSYALNYLVDKGAGDPEAEFSVDELVDAMVSGGISGLVMGGGASAIGTALNGRAGSADAHRSAQIDKTYQNLQENGMFPGKSADELLLDYARGIDPLTSDTKAQNSAQAQEAGKNKNSLGSWRERSYSENGKTFVQSADGQRMYEVPNQNEIQYHVTDDGTVSLNEDVISNLDPKDYRDFIKTYCDLNLVTKYDAKTFEITEAKPILVKDTGQEVLITQAGINDVLKKMRGAGIKSRDNVSSMLLLNKIIENMHYDSQANNTKGRENPFTYYTGRFSVGGRDYNVKVDIKNVPQGDRYYYHSLEGIKIEPSNGTSGVNADLYPLVNDSLSDTNISQNDSGVNTYDMQNEGENAQGIPTYFNEGGPGAAQANPEAYSALQNRYGTIEPGENPARVVDVPISTDGTNRTRQYARTLMEAAATPGEMLADYEQQVANGLFSYSAKSDQKAVDTAVNTITRHGFDGAMEQWGQVVEGRRTATKEDITLAQMMYTEAAKVGDYDTAMRLAAEIAAEGTRAGQNVQALRLLKKTTPEGRLYYMQKSVEALQNELQKKFGKEAPDLQIDNALVEEYLKAPTEEARFEVQERIYDSVAAQLPKTFGDRFNAWRYFAMLGNPRTHIRNLVGNIMFQAPVRIKNKVGSLLELALVPQEQRTKALFQSKEARQFAQADYAQMADVLGGNKYSELQEIKQRQKLFPAPLQKVIDFNSKALDMEDNLFKKMTYINSMAEFLTARRADVNHLDANTLEQARGYAINEAKKATFQDASATADMLSRLEKKNKAAEILVGGLVPFKRTPINIVKRGMEYSPAGLIKGVTYDLTQVKNGTMTATEAIDHISAGLTGTGITVLGAFLASQGLLSGEGDEDDKKRSFDAAQGSQNYALNLGDASYTIDWAAPAALPLFVGAEMWNTMQEKDEGLTLETALESMEKILGPAFNLTMLDGISGAIKSASYAQENPISAVVGNTVQNFVGQVTPTLLGQVARTADGTRRTTYANKENGIPDSWETFLQRQTNKIPGLSQNNPAYVDVWGRTDETPNIALRAFENFLSPGYISQKKSGPVEEELQRIYEQTGQSGVLPSYAEKQVKYDGEAYHFSAKEYTAYAQTLGQTAYQILEDLVGRKGYQGLTDAEKGDVVQMVYDYAKKKAKEEMLRTRGILIEDSTYKKVKDAEAEGIAPADYYLAYYAQKDITGDKDKDGKTINLSSSANKKAAVDAVTNGLSKKQKEALYEAFGISDKVYKATQTAEERMWELLGVPKPQPQKSYTEAEMRKLLGLG